MKKNTVFCLGYCYFACCIWKARTVTKKKIVAFPDIPDKLLPEWRIKMFKAIRVELLYYDYEPKKEKK